jgi:hypothetical protein
MPLMEMADTFTCDPLLLLLLLLAPEYAKEAAEYELAIGDNRSSTESKSLSSSSNDATIDIAENVADQK